MRSGRYIASKAAAVIAKPVKTDGAVCPVLDPIATTLLQRYRQNKSPSQNGSGRGEVGEFQTRIFRPNVQLESIAGLQPLQKLR
jgi:hypothetical protein